MTKFQKINYPIWKNFSWLKSHLMITVNWATLMLSPIINNQRKVWANLILGFREYDALWAHRYIILNKKKESTLSNYSKMRRANTSALTVSSYASRTNLARKYRFKNLWKNNRYVFSSEVLNSGNKLLKKFYKM